jgi:predicted  nucleic acid-binding Zn-ribbon protein
MGTIRSLEATVQGFEERAAELETDISDSQKRAKELEGKVGAHFEHEERYQKLSHRQSEIEEKLDLAKNQAPSQVEAVSVEENEEKNSETQNKTSAIRPKQRMTVSV